MFASLAVKCVAECAGKPNFNLGDLLAAEAHKHSVALGRKMSSQQITAKSLKKTTGFLADCNVFVCLAGAVGVYKKAADTINQLQGRERKATRVAAKKH
ncbi:hypothetical protein QJQ45_012352 [Haematococcus lacustris]|nr:hypothetical protein QJQ45_012352 [Haematococcus lacustris]